MMAGLQNIGGEAMTLGQLIRALETVDGGFWIADYTFHSYRGYYDRLGLEPTGSNTTVAAMLDKLRGQVGAVHCGYKGGEYVMWLGTKLHVATWGDTGDVVYGVTITDSDVRLATAPEAW